MQTFLPSPNFEKSAEALRVDMERLGKQRVETYQILLALKNTSSTGLRGGWSRHPASRMWENFELALLEYQQEICKVWTSMGYTDTCWEKSKKLFSPEELKRFEAKDYEYPSWLGDEDFHLRHQSNLVRKAPQLYRAQFPEVDDTLEYIWPGKTLEEAKNSAGV